MLANNIKHSPLWTSVTVLNKCITNDYVIVQSNL
jgi:hypothetical protein